MQGSGGDAVSGTEWSTFLCAAGVCVWLSFLSCFAFYSILLTFVRHVQEIETIVLFDPLHCPLILWAWSEEVGPFTVFMERAQLYIVVQGRTPDNFVLLCHYQSRGQLIFLSRSCWTILHAVMRRGCETCKGLAPDPGESYGGRQPLS